MVSDLGGREGGEGSKSPRAPIPQRRQENRMPSVLLPRPLMVQPSRWVLGEETDAVASWAASAKLREELFSFCTWVWGHEGVS